MTANRSDRDLPAILEDLYLGPSPDYRHEALAAVRRTRQRPPWTFPGRWLPMADIAQRSILAPGVRWRAAGLALLIVALLLFVAALVVGSRQTRLPSPFGLAGNGRIAYAINGDIYTIDPATGRSTPIVTGPDNDFDPVFSPDGTRVAFRRDTTVDGSPGEAIVVAAADGSNPVVVTDRMDTQPGYFEWLPSSRSLLVEDPNGAGIWQLDALTPAEPRVITTNASMLERPFRPPEGDEVLIQRSVDGATQLVVHNLASGEETVLVAAEPGLELGGAAGPRTATG